MSLEALIATYGYAAVGIGTFLEGETILVLAGFAAHRGYLELPWVIFWAFAGSFFGDQLFFQLGRRKGRAVLASRPHWQARSGKVFALLDRHHIGLILGFRFLYGMRTVTPIIIGASRVPPGRFFMLNLLGAAIWAITIGTLGYLFGDALEILVGDVKRYELLVFAGLAAAGGTAWIVHLLRARTISPHNDGDDSRHS